MWIPAYHSDTIFLRDSDPTHSEKLLSGALLTGRPAAARPTVSHSQPLKDSQNRTLVQVPLKRQEA